MRNPLAASVPAFAVFSVQSLLNPVHAQVAPPDAGQIRQQLQQAVPAAPAEAPVLKWAAPVQAPVATGGPTVILQAVVIEGNTVLPTERLQALLADAHGKSLDLAGLRGLANRITRAYHKAGYAYAQALLPAQTMDHGELHILVLEGRYGKVTITGPRAASAQSWLSVLQPGTVIATDPLQRRLDMLAQLPGVSIDPVLDPGANTGEGDLTVNVDLTRRLGGSVTLDDDGNRYTGQERASASLFGNSLLLFGDHASLDALASNEHLYLGAFGYDAALGTSGLRGEAHVSRSTYALGADFESLDAHGLSDTVSAGLSFPLLRSKTANVTLGTLFQHAYLHDDVDSAGTRSNARTNSIPVSLHFDERDTLLSTPGLSYGAFTWTPGRLSLDPGQVVADATTARTAGRYDKLNLDLSRLQSLTSAVSLYARLAAQWSSKNLNSSERFGLGGQAGVRAYPLGEGYGDEGWVLQTEARGTIGVTAPYVFYDMGRVTINRTPWMPGGDSRLLSGAGFGLRATAWRHWNAELSLAFRTDGGRPQSDTRDLFPVVHASLNCTF